jgi:hypothetical protein
MRGIVIAFLLLFSLSAQGQMVIDSYRFGAPAGPLLDDYPNAAAAYSLRLLRTGYTGSAIQVRRSSDSDTTSIGFSGNYLDTAALKTFCGTGATDTCFVRIWFDQSFSNRNLAKTTNANQPFILLNGVITRVDGIAAIDFSRDADNLTASGYGFLSVDSNFTAIAVTKANSTAAMLIFNNLVNTNDRIRLDIDRFTFSVSGTLIGKSFTSTTNKLIYFAENSPQTLYANSVLATGGSNSSPFNISGFSLAGRADNATGSNYNGNIYEVIFYNTNQSSNRTAIETNINNFYQIY